LLGFRGARFPALAEAESGRIPAVPIPFENRTN
jgi:hypothetical protein